jgi:hypothetical protein
MPLDIGRGGVSGNFAAGQALMAVSGLCVTICRVGAGGSRRHQHRKKRQKLDRLCTRAVNVYNAQVYLLERPV